MAMPLRLASARGRCYTAHAAPRRTRLPKMPPLLRERPRAQIIILAGVVPVVFGVIAGFALDRSAAVYFVLLGLAAIGGIGAGFDHDGAGEGARRGLLGGVLFTAGILGTNELIGGAAHADELPHPYALLFVINGAFGVLFGAIGGRMRARRTRVA